MAGRVKGQLNNSRREAKEFAARLVDDPEYRQNLYARGRAGTLHPSIENTLLFFRFGKPKETVEVQHPDGANHLDLEDMSPAELAKEAESLAKSLTEAAAQQKENDEVLYSERSSNEVHLFGIGGPDDKDGSSGVH